MPLALIRRPSPTLLLLLATVMGCQVASPADQGSTHIAIGSSPLHSGVKRLGINLSGQSYYDSGQMLRNLVYRNPGFEGETWQSILRCKLATATSCTDENKYTVWPAGFLNGARFELISGAGKGQSGIVTDSTAAGPDHGISFTFAPLGKATAPGDFILVHAEKPGKAEAGWWTELSPGAHLSTEFKDLAPGTSGQQALRLEASAVGQSAAVISYFDSTEGHSFVHLHGIYRLSFRAKALSGERPLKVELQRLSKSGRKILFAKDIPLTAQWRVYTFDLPTAEDASAMGTVGLSFHVHEATILLDDVSLAPATQAANNNSAFRDEVVDTLRALQPGILRYMDNGTNFGSSLDNMLAPPFGRRRTGFSTQSKLQEDIPIGLHEFLTLAQTVGAEPWYAMPAGISPTEARNLIEYLAGDPKTRYGARRAALGQRAPWTSVFPVIHLELGNELWNSGSFYGATISDVAAHGERAAEIFRAARSHPAYRPASFDLILGAWAANAWWTGQQLAHSGGYNTTAVAPYLFDNFKDASSTEAIFGPMFAQPESLDSLPNGAMAQQLEAAKKASPAARLAVYEVNLGTMAGSATQANLDATLPSMGAGLAVVDHMLLMLRDLGITDQALFALPEFGNGFSSTTGVKETIPLWGAVVDMGGATNLRRPQFLAEQLANQAILQNMLPTSLSGANPTWNQPRSANDEIELREAHCIQSFAFADGQHRSLILLNLSRTQTLPVDFTGVNAPLGEVEQSRLTAKHITDNNETQPNVTIQKSSLPDFHASRAYQLPPFSMTVLKWTSPR